MARAQDQEACKDEVEIHGDILEVILSHVPLIDLVSASRVSKTWCYAVASGLRHLNKPKPWLILHKEATRHPYTISTYAHDPRTHMWMKLVQPDPIKFTSELKSSHCNFLYAFSFSRLSFSFDPLNLTWSHVYPPFGWRADPIVAHVGDSIIVAGGGCDYASDPSPVEIYNIGTHSWESYDNLPGHLLDMLASIYLSIATTNEKLFVTEKQSGTTCWFSVKSKRWSRPYNFNLGHHDIVDYNIGIFNDDLILVGLCKNLKNGQRLRIWKVEGENSGCEEIGEMPCPYVEKLKSESFETSSINARVIGNFVYIYNRSKAEEIVVCELMTTGARAGAGGAVVSCRWWSIQNVVSPDEMKMDRLVFSCSQVGFDALQQAIMSKDHKLMVECIYGDMTRGD